MKSSAFVQLKIHWGSLDRSIGNILEDTGYPVFQDV